MTDAAPKYAIGIDFGTSSARTLLLDLVSGEEAALCELPYAHGVIDTTLPATGERLTADWALHDPDDYISVLERGIARVLSDVPGAARHVIGIGLDATCCSVLPVTGDGVPLCRIEPWRSHPHAYLKLWKHHAPAHIASRLSQVAAERGEPFLARCGGQVSSEWYFPKIIETWLEDRPVYDAAASFVEVADWLVWYLCGRLRRATSPAAYKALWSAEEGLPPDSFFAAAFPGFGPPEQKLGRDFYQLGTPAGRIRPELAARLGLPSAATIAVGNIDAFAAFPGAGVKGPGTFFMTIGTSACDLVVHERQIPLSGITGVAKDGIIPGLYGYEAGEAATGDMLGWFARTMAPASDTAELLAELETRAAKLAPGETGLVALDWWNGNRSILADADLSGAIVGLSLQTSPAEIYRSLLEAIAFGNTEILNNFRRAGFEFTEIVACGGIAVKSPLLMQLIADVSGMSLSVPAAAEVTARGAALFGAVAAGVFPDISRAAWALRPATARRYSPGRQAGLVYQEVYGIFTALHDTLGRDHAGWLHELKRIKRRMAGAASHVPL